MNKYDLVRERLLHYNGRSAWSRGVHVYALEMVDLLEENQKEITKQALLYGADSWQDYVYGASGVALVYDGDIAERLCTPSELKRTKNGLRRPNSHENWLDVEVRAVTQAANRVLQAARWVIK